MVIYKDGYAIVGNGFFKESFGILLRCIVIFSLTLRAFADTPAKPEPGPTPAPDAM